MWVRGVEVVKGGSPVGVDLAKLRELLRKAQPSYRDPESKDPSCDPGVSAAEAEKRAAMGLDQENSTAACPDELASFEDGRVLYCQRIP